MAESPDQTELAELFARLAAGDRSALSRAFGMLHPLIQGFCQRLLGRGADADDATQQTLERIFEEMGSYDVNRQPLPWIFTLATWEVRTIRRRRWRSEQRAASVGIEEAVSSAEDPETAAMSRQVLFAMNEAVETLPELDRQTLNETFARELTADISGSSDATFRKRKERALHRIRALLRNLGHVQ